VPYFAGVLTGEVDALVDSFADEPEVHHPVRGRIRGEAAFAAYAADTKAWLEGLNASVEDVDFIFHDGRGVEEVVLRLDGEDGKIELPVAIATDRPSGRIVEMRVYYSSWPLTGRHANRPPVLQPSPGVRAPDLVGEYQRALASGDRDAIVAMFEPDGYAREPAGPEHVHRSAEGLGEFYGWLFSNGGGIPLEHCSILDDGRACALEYNVVRWGQTELPPQAGIAVYERGEGGKLAAARIYDDLDPPLGPPA
jgi:hypothetical protein